MRATGISPIGFDVNELISLQGRRHLYDLETFISCCLAIRSTELDQTYNKLRSLGPERLKQVISDPLFSIAIHNLIRGEKESSGSFGSNGALQARWLIDDLSKTDFRALFNTDNVIHLPSDGIVLQSNKPLDGLNIHRQNGKLFVSPDQHFLELAFDKDSNFRRLDLSEGHWLMAGKYTGDVFRIDSISSMYIPVIPDDYEREWSSPHELKRWSESIAEAVRLLQLCKLDGILTELKLLVRIIVPLKYRKDSHISSSSPDLPGIICMSWANDVLQVLETIVHEAGHHKLCLIERERPITDSSEAIFHSPWRDDLRPARGLVHGSYAFICVAALWNSLLKSESLPKRFAASISHRQLIVLRQIRDALSELTKAKCLTETGRDVVESIKRVHNDLAAGCNYDLAGVEIQTGHSRAGKGNREHSLLDEFSNDCDWLLPLYNSIRDSIDTTIRRAGLDEKIVSTIKERLPFYYLWWGAPLVEAFGLSKNLEEAEFWVRLHICFGLIWRFVDDVEDGHSTGIREQHMFYDAALALLIENSGLLQSREIQVSRRSRRLLFEFYAYRSVEKAGDIKAKDIWRRASTFLVVPDILGGAERAGLKAFREYCIFLGLLDDLEDGWEDLAAGRRTWITNLLSTKSLAECRLEIRSMCDRYKRRLQKIVPAGHILWWKLLDDSFARCARLISVVL
jgi:HEXXH motif-containing protein